MNTIKEYNGKKIRIIGTKLENERTAKLLDNHNIIGNESSDRLIIQDIIDKENIKSTILYDGNSVISYEKPIRLFKKYNKKRIIDNLCDYIYEFLYIQCGDIAHYNKNGYIAYYNGDFEQMKKHVIFASNIPSWRTDLIKVINGMKQINETM